MLSSNLASHTSGRITHYLASYLPRLHPCNVNEHLRSVAYILYVQHRNMYAAVLQRRAQVLPMMAARCGARQGLIC